MRHRKDRKKPLISAVAGSREVMALYRPPRISISTIDINFECSLDRTLLLVDNRINKQLDHIHISYTFTISKSNI